MYIYMQHHEIYFILLAFFSELIGTLSGVSSSTIFVPMGRLFESAQITLVLTATLHVLGNSTRAVLFWRHIDWNLVFRFGGPAILMTAVGAYFSDLFPGHFDSILLGIFLISFSLFMLKYPDTQIFSGKYLPFLGGALSGFLTGMIGSGGAVRSLALTFFQLNPLTFVATSTLIDFGGDIVRLFIYIQKGYFNREHWFYIPFLMLVALFANLLAKKWMHRIPQRSFQKIVLIFVCIMGFVSLLSPWIQ